ncbi:hypothetical protein M0804_010607 [Polistes exclamans]|nr:hypothetical protein M0804_010607 [Polistes exclamans]
MKKNRKEKKRREEVDPTKKQEGKGPVMEMGFQQRIQWGLSRGPEFIIFRPNGASNSNSSTNNTPPPSHDDPNMFSVYNKTLL